jgi:hypothetical protein
MAIAITTGPVVSTLSTTPNQRLSITTLTPDSSYPTGGYTVTAAQLGLSNIADALCNLSSSAANNTAVSATYNQATGKLMLWVAAASAPDAVTEAASTANLSGTIIKVWALGY